MEVCLVSGEGRWVGAVVSRGKIWCYIPLYFVATTKPCRWSVVAWEGGDSLPELRALMGDGGALRCRKTGP